MDFMDLAKTRRSVRSYESRDIRREELELCVEAARYAPSACNAQPWKFVIVDAPEKKAELAGIFPGPRGMNLFARGAAAFIVMISEKQNFPAWAGGKIRRTDFRRMDIGMACQNLVLEAQELGIGTCILGWFNERKVKKILSVPLRKKVELIIALGYPLEAEFHERKLKERSEAVTFNGY